MIDINTNISNAMEMLHRWARFAERDWLQLDDTGIGCYGSGFNYWGVQTNQKYLAAMAVLAVKGENVPGLDRSQLPTFLYCWQPETSLVTAAGG